MYPRHAIDVMAPDNGEMGHAYVVIPVVVNERQALHEFRIARMTVAHAVQEPLVDFVDDFKMPRQDGGKQPHRPGLQRLGHQRMVGVGKGAHGNPPGAIPFQFMYVHEQAHELGDRYRRMGIVQLDRDLVRQFVEAGVNFLVAEQDVLQRGTDEEILLFQTQRAPRGRGIIGVEYLRQIFRGVLVLDRLDVIAFVEKREIEITRRLG